MKNLISLSVLVASATFGLAGCSDVGFESLPSKTCTNFNGQGQSCIPGQSTNTYNYSFRTGDVDILIVNDNSGSMHPEQLKMAQKFPNFLSSISHLFYQIAMVTTDITSPESGPNAPHNGNGAWRDGKFLPFSQGEYVLNNSTVGINQKFSNTIQRQETINCGSTGNFESTSCPSGDERGIYAMNLAAERNEQNFFRPGAHLAVIILSDEDERSSVEFHSTTRPLESRDLPETFLQTMLSKYPSKTVSVHPIIIKPNDSSCLNAQTQSTGGPFSLKGFYGHIYAEFANNPDLQLAFSNFTGGFLGNICASDYGAQLGDIGSFVSDEARRNELQLPCAPAANDVQVTASNGSQLNYTIDGSNRMIFENLPVGVTVNVAVSCPSSI